METAIVVKELTKTFGSFVSVDRVTFSVTRGEVFGFLGPNGAGKSTTIRMLCGLLKPTSGEGRVAGFDIDREPDRVKERIGYMSQRFSLYEDLTPMENLMFYGGVYRLTGQKLRDRIDFAVEMADLKTFQDRMTRALPGGWKQRLALGCALLHEPEIVFLDEPTGGVDPVSRRQFWGLIDALSGAGVTVFVTTHLLDEAEYCARIGMMSAGRLIAIGSPGELRKRFMPRSVYEVTVSNPIRAVTFLEQEPWVRLASILGMSIHVEIEEGWISGGGDDSEVKAHIVSFLQEHRLSPSEPEPVVPSLDDVFITAIERANDVREFRQDVAYREKGVPADRS
ncbi:MAG: ABC transporter ATP-binding protein [Candidatus Latescibacteria bacterium]|nr:ABC transporter ATP-binding protein [Candidatus Latescibacterota bacterium]